MKFLSTILGLVIFSPLLLSSGGNVVKAEELNKAVNGQKCENMPDSIANLNDAYFSAIKDTYCELRYGEAQSADADLFELVVVAAINADPPYVFLGTCLQDVLEGMQAQQAEAAAKDALGPCEEDDREGTAISRLECEDTQSKILTLSGLTSTLRSTVNPWNLFMCKSATCDTDNLNQVLSAIYFDYFAAGGDDAWRTENFTVIDTYTPTVECFYDQIRAPLHDTELYCSGESAPVCNNTKLVEVKLGVDAPFEVAICDDNDCLASVGTPLSVSILADGYGPNPFCLPEEKNYPRELTEVLITYSEKEFNLSDYCSVAAASGRTGRCTTSKSPKSPKSPKAPKLPKGCKKSNKSNKSSKVPKGLRA